MNHSVRTVQSARIARFGSGATIIRARGAEGLSMDDMRASVPSVFAGEKHGSHPTAAGSYLAACVFYATLTHRSPVGINQHPAALTAPDADALAKMASNAVLGH